MQEHRALDLASRWLKAPGLRLDVRNEEVPALLQGFLALFLVLGSYFLIRPLADDASVVLGTATLPKLFASTLILTLFATPAASAYLARPRTPRTHSIRRLFRMLAATLTGFFLVYAVTEHTAQASSPSRPQPRQLQHRAIPSPSEERSELASSHSPSLHIKRAVSLPSIYDADRRHFHDSNGVASAPAYAAGAGKRSRQLLQRDIRAGDSSKTWGQKAVRVCFYVWLSVINLIGASVLWARMADVFNSQAGLRLFGFLGAGATCGQLAGSVIASAWVRSPFGTSEHAMLRYIPILLSALMLEAAGKLTASLKAPASSSTRQPSPDAAQAHARDHTRLWESLEGFRLILRSPYLLHLCAYLVCNASVSAFVYFERTMVVAAASEEAAGRLAMFANINSTSALAILGLQLTATGKLLKGLGVAWALACSPLLTAGLFALVYLHPSFHVVAAAEVIRKVVTYSLAKPAREVLFTVVTREERYQAKLCIDTLVMRMGDTAAGGLFHLLDTLLHSGPSGCALGAVPLCLASSAVAWTLGCRHMRMAAASETS